MAAKKATSRSRKAVKKASASEPGKAIKPRAVAAIPLKKKASSGKSNATGAARMTATARSEPRPASATVKTTPTGTRRVFSIVDLFAGAGGISEGFRQAGFAVLAGSDNDPDAMATYAHNFPEAGAIVGDVRDRAVRARILEHARAASVIVGGPPCQAFSQVRNHSRMIDDPRNSLYREFVNVLRDALPPAFVMENVTGIDQMGAREQIASDLELGGEYRVLAQVVDAADFGVPQTRKRLLFIGVRASSAMSPPRLSGTGATEAIELVRRVGPKKSSYELREHKTLLNEGVYSALCDANDPSVVSAEDAISDLAWLPSGNRKDELHYPEVPGARTAYQHAMRIGASPSITNVQVPRMLRDTELRLKSIPPGGNFRDLKEHLLERYISGDKWGQSNGSGKLSRQHFYAYRRLHGGIWAWTLNTKADSVYHYSVARALSVREFARLQSFPDRFAFTTDPQKGALPGRHDGGPAHSRYRQAGNAVPPLLAKAAANALLQQLQLAQPAERKRSRASS